MDLLSLSDRVTNAIALGESHFREFKSAFEGRPGDKRPRSRREICRDIGEALVSFANADGGELLVGVEDDGTITGISHGEEDVQLMLNACKTHAHEDCTLPLVAATRVIIDAKTILYYCITKGSNEIYQTQDGRCLVRKDKENIPITFKRLTLTIQEQRSRAFDRAFVDGAAVTDLNLSLVQEVANSYLTGLSPERYLQQSSLAEYSPTGMRLKNAALLLFAANIQKWQPRSQVRILKVNGTSLLTGEQYNVLNDEVISGNIFELLQSSWDALRPYLAYKTEFGQDAKFEQRYLYPEHVCREAIINALAHRDYSVQNGIDVYIFDDRLEIKSPGPLLSTITIEEISKLTGAHESRNPLIAKILRENNVMRELGEGMRRIFSIMAENDLKAPQLLDDGQSFSVIMEHRSVYSDKQEAWLKLFGEYSLSRNEKKIVVLGIGDKPISTNDIYRALNTKDRDVYDRSVSMLRMVGILQPALSDQRVAHIARTRNISRRAVPRFKVVLPSKPLADNIVFIQKIPLTTTRQQLHSLFIPFGAITRIDIPVYNNTPKGYAFIAFENKDSASNAIQKMNGFKFGDTQLTVLKYMKSNR